MTLHDLLERRTRILEELAGLVQLRRGSITEQMVEFVDAQGRKGQRGPYPLLTFKEKGRTVSQRLHGAHEVAQCRQQIENFRRFEQLTLELREVGEQLCETEGLSVEKKRRRSPSSKTRK
jgi:hypothetical protein